MPSGPTPILGRYPGQAAPQQPGARVPGRPPSRRSGEPLGARDRGRLDDPAALLGLHGVHLLAGKFAESRRTLDLIGRRLPDNPLLLTVEVQDAAAQQDWEGAERRAEANIAAKQGDTLQLVDAFEQMAGIVMTQGRLEEAERHWRTQLLSRRRQRVVGRRLYGAQMLGLLVCASGTIRRGGRRGGSALARHAARQHAPGRPPLLRAGTLLRRGGRRGARGPCWRSRQRAPDGPRGAERAWTEGTILMAEGRTQEAEPLYAWRRTSCAPYAHCRTGPGAGRAGRCRRRDRDLRALPLDPLALPIRDGRLRAGPGASGSPSCTTRAATGAGPGKRGTGCSPSGGAQTPSSSRCSPTCGPGSRPPSVRAGGERRGHSASGSTVRVKSFQRSLGYARTQPKYKPSPSRSSITKPRRPSSPP